MQTMIQIDAKEGRAIDLRADRNNKKITGDELSEMNKSLLMMAQEGNEKAVEKLVILNEGLVRKIAARYIGRGTELEDLVQIGMLGMVKAIRGFDSARGTAFSTYAVPLINGEIRCHLRDDGIIKVGRQQKKLGAEIAALRAKILSDEGREAGIEELAKRCGISSADAAMALEAISPISSLSDKLTCEGDGCIEDVISDGGDEAGNIIDRVALSQVISAMQPLWRKIVLLRYFRNFTQSETADSLGLTQVKISREEKKILEHLKYELVK